MKLIVSLFMLILCSRASAREFPKEPFVDGEGILPYVLIVVGRSGSSWLCSRIAAHPCGACYQEDPCALMSRHVVKNDKNVNAGSYWLAKGEHEFSMTRNYEKYSNKLQRCPIPSPLVLGAKCGPDRDVNITDDWDVQGRKARFVEMLKRVNSSKIIYMYRNNTLDWFLASGGAPGSEKHSVDIDVVKLISKIKNKMKFDQLVEQELKQAALENNMPFHTVVYENVCSNPNVEMEELYQFLGLHNATLNDLANAVPDKAPKRHTMTHKSMFKNYNAVHAALQKHGLEEFLKDEKCTMLRQSKNLAKK
jgi:hypothetical protein